MQESLVIRLLDFGFTINQAKVYLNIVQSGTTYVGDISKSTQLHRQDVYKLLPKLKKMGLITTTIDKPVIIEAIPMEKALKRLVTAEKRSANQRIRRLEANLKELIKAIRGQQKDEVTREQEEPRYMLLTTDAEIKNRRDLTFENATIECNWVTSLELMKLRMQRFHECFQKLSRNRVRMRVIIENLNDKDIVKRTIEKIRPRTGDFEAKLIPRRASIPYQIVDHKEVWIAVKRETEKGFPCILWTDDKNIIQFRRDNFEKAWNDPRALTIYPKRDREKRK